MIHTTALFSGPWCWESHIHNFPKNKLSLDLSLNVLRVGEGISIATRRRTNNQRVYGAIINTAKRKGRKKRERQKKEKEKEKGGVVENNRCTDLCFPVYSGVAAQFDRSRLTTVNHLNKGYKKRLYKLRS